MRSEPVPDRMITQQVNNKLACRGVGAPCHVTVLTKNGEVTLSGTVRHGHQKAAAVQATTGIAGVRRVIDRMTVKAKAV
jgi:osmotically-inducible protein OsmY